VRRDGGFQNQRSNFANKWRVVRERIRVVVANESAILHLKGVILPVIHVSSSVRPDDAVNAQGGAECYRAPEGERRARHQSR
jgi:hypothetical protein